MKGYFQRFIVPATSKTGALYWRVVWGNGRLDLIVSGVTFNNVTPAEEWFVACGGIA